MEGTTRAGQLTLATTDEAAQQLGIGGMMTTGHLGIPIAPALDRLKGLLADDRGHRNGHPCLRWRGLLALPRPHGPQRGLAMARGGWTCPPTLGHPGIDRRPQDATHRCDVPAGLPGRGRDLGLTEAFGNARQAHRGLRLPIPGKHLCHDRCLDWINTEAAGVTEMVGIQDVAIGRARPRQEWATAEFGMPAPAHTISHQGPLVLRHRPPHVQQQLIVRIMTHRPFQEFDLTPPLREFIDPQHLMDIVACQASGGSDEDPLTGSHGGPIP
jgi:hypothetical protein